MPRRRLPWPWAASIALHGAMLVVAPPVGRASDDGGLPYGASAFGDDDAGVLVDLEPWPEERKFPKAEATLGSAAQKAPPPPVVKEAKPEPRKRARRRPRRRKPRAPKATPPKAQPKAQPKPLAPEKPEAAAPKTDPLAPKADPGKPAAAKPKTDAKPAAAKPDVGAPPKPGASEPGAPGDNDRPGAKPKPAEPGAKPAPPSTGAEPGEGEGKRPKTRRGYRPLTWAFSRELPVVVSRDPVWEKLPVGAVGSVTVVATIGEDGRIKKLRARGDAPKALKKAVKRTRPALGGRFRLSEGEVAGEEVLRIDVRLEQREPPAKQKIHYDFGRRPTQKRPGRVFFITESGRYFEATVTILSSTPK